MAIFRLARGAARRIKGRGRAPDEPRWYRAVAEVQRGSHVGQWRIPLEGKSGRKGEAQVFWEILYPHILHHSGSERWPRSPAGEPASPGLEGSEPLRSICINNPSGCTLITFNYQSWSFTVNYHPDRNQTNSNYFCFFYITSLICW